MRKIYYLVLGAAVATFSMPAAAQASKLERVPYPERIIGLFWGVGAALRGDQNLADWTLVVQVSGATTKVGDDFVEGVALGLRDRC